MAESRIINYDGEFVTFWYQRHNDDLIIIEKVSVYEFIKKVIKDMIKHTKNYFGDDEKIYICKCNKYDTVPRFVVNKQLSFLKFSNQKTSYKMQCPYCGGKAFPINLNKV